MSWTQIGQGHVGENPLELYRSQGDFMIRVDGFELMNSRWSRSEKQMARFARDCSTAEAPRLLIGGLGLGYTLSAVIQEFPKSEIVVAELSEEVLLWYQTHFKRELFPEMDDSAVEFLRADVRDILRTRTFDLILLDVDNGPEPLSTRENAALYSGEGLRRCVSALKSGGSVIVWSAFTSPAFQAAAEAEGCSWTVHEVAVGCRDHRHYLYRLIR